MNFKKLKELNGVVQMDYLGNHLYRGETSDHRELIVRTIETEDMTDETVSAVIYDGERADICDECGKVHYVYDLEIKDGFTLCEGCLDKLAETSKEN